MNGTIAKAIKNRARRLADNVERFQASRFISAQTTQVNPVEADIPRGISDAIVDSRGYRSPELPEPAYSSQFDLIAPTQPRPDLPPDLPVSIHFEMPARTQMGPPASDRSLKVIP